MGGLSAKATHCDGHRLLEPCQLGTMAGSLNSARFRNSEKHPERRNDCFANDQVRPPAAFRLKFYRGPRAAAREINASTFLESYRFSFDPACVGPVSFR